MVVCYKPAPDVCITASAFLAIYWYSSCTSPVGEPSCASHIVTTATVQRKIVLRLTSRATIWFRACCHLPDVQQIYSGLTTDTQYGTVIHSLCYSSRFTATTANLQLQQQIYNYNSRFTTTTADLQLVCHGIRLLACCCCWHLHLVTIAHKSDIATEAVMNSRHW